MLEQLLCQTLSVRGRLDVPIAALACHDEHGELVRQNRRGFRPKGRKGYLVLRLFFLHVVNEILERGLYDDAIKPGSIVASRIDVVDDAGVRIVPCR
jgi:hypothetical protein